jgi:hypothetical protein
MIAEREAVSKTLTASRFALMAWKMRRVFIPSGNFSKEV